MSQWKKLLLEGASELFTRGRKSKDKEEGQAKEAELFQQIGRLKMELEWLKKSLSCSDARELRKLVDHEHPELGVSRQCAPLGLLRSTLYDQPTAVRESTLRIMAWIVALYLEDPCSGSLRMLDYLAREGIPISRRAVFAEHPSAFDALADEPGHHTAQNVHRGRPLLAGPHLRDGQAGSVIHRHKNLLVTSAGGASCAWFAGNPVADPVEPGPPRVGAAQTDTSLRCKNLARYALIQVPTDVQQQPISGLSVR